MRRARFKAAGFLDARPSDAQCAEFRERRKFVGVGRQAERDERTGFGEAYARPFDEAHEADAAGERKGELLRRAAAGRMDAARVGY